REREREEQSSDNGELGLNRALTVDSSPPIEEEEPKTQRFDPGTLPPLRRERCAIVFALAAGAAYLNNWLVWPLYWFAQGTMFWALFVLGLYSCPLPWLVHFAFKPISGKQLADYFCLLHMSEKIYKSLDKPTRFFRFTLPLVMLAYPFYLVIEVGFNQSS
ncbi:hypothetical protein HID58_046274, partial [Brassica napus]